MEKELREQVIKHLEEDIRGILCNLELARKSKDSNSSIRWVKCLEETIQVYNGLKETSLDEEVEKRVERILKLPQYREQLALKENVLNSYGDKSVLVYECDMKKRKADNFETDFYSVLHDDSKFLLDVSLYPRGCGKTKILKNVAKIRYNNVIVLIPSTQILSYENELNNKNTNTKIISVSKDLDSFRGISFSKDAILVCEEGFSINEILDMKYKYGINIQCALVNGVE